MTQVPVPVRERGYAVADGTSYWTRVQDEQVPELRWPNDILIYQRMMTDAQIGSVLQAVSAPIERTWWGLDGSGVDNEVTTSVASNFGLPIKGDNTRTDYSAALRGRDRFSWRQHLVESLEMLPFGHAVFEQVYRPDEQNPNRHRLRKLGYRPADTLAKFNIASDGGLISIEQKARSGVISTRTTNPVLPINRLVVYSHGRRGANWRGRSVLRACYKNWLLKDDGNRTWAIALQRNGMGVPVYSAGTTDQGEIDAGLDIATRARAGDSSGVSIGKGATLEFKGVDGTTIDPDKFVRYQDEQIARAVLAHFLNLGTQTGSWALGSTFADFFTLSLQAIAEELRDVATQHAIEDFVDVNFGPTVPAPRLVFDEIGSRGGVTGELDVVREAAGLQDDDDLATFIRTNTAAAA